MEHLKNWTNFITKYSNILIKNEQDVYYLTKFHSTNMFVLVINKKKYVLTDQRYFESAKEQLSDFVVVDMADKQQFLGAFKQINNGELFINEKDFTIHAYQVLSNFFKINNLKINLQPIYFPPLRIIKGKEELADTKKAIAITDNIFDEIVAWIKPGMTELEVFKKIMILTIESEATKESFSPIVAAGINGSSPHWHSSDYIISKNDMITIDMGVFYRRGCSDMTRTFILGVPTEKQKTVHKLVNSAMELAISKIKPGISFKELDRIARDFLENNGYGPKYFTHSLGHGIGVDIHEPPTVAPNSDEIVESGMIFTIEPGIYIPHEMGCRIEQDILVTKTGHEILNKSQTNLEIIYNNKD